MKIVETTVAKTVVVKEPVTQYIADDGKIFYSEEECKNYENEEKYKARFEEMIIAPVHIPDAFNVYDANIFLMKVNSREDIEALVKASEIRNGAFFDSYVEESVPKAIKELPCRVIYFENDAIADIYSADGLFRECLDIALTLVK